MICSNSLIHRFHLSSTIPKIHQIKMTNDNCAMDKIDSIKKTYRLRFTFPLLHVIPSFHQAHLAHMVLSASIYANKVYSRCGD